MANNITMKYVCPVIGMISSGKSSFLNALLNMDCLEASADVTTKIVTIIRYNSNLTEPRFFQLTVNNDGNDNYSFQKANKPTVTGIKAIKEEIIKVNKENKKINENPNYKDIFYMLEIGEVKFIEKEFLKNYDLADVPGVSEYIKPSNDNKNDSNTGENPDSQNKGDLTVEDSNINIESEINYLTQIFKILKNIMNNGIFIFSVDKLLLRENYLIIHKLQMVLNKPIENFLILLNKMDKSEDIERDMNLLNERFVKEFPKGTFNFIKNTVVQCSSFQIENELNMQNQFANLLYYNYINYIMKPKDFSNFRDYMKRFIEEQYKKETISIDKKEFKDNIKSIINDKSIKKIQEIIETINKNHNDKPPVLLAKEDFNDLENNINKIFKKLVIEDSQINLFSQTNFVIIILYYLYLFKEKKLKFIRSSETETILTYFTIQNMNLKSNHKEIELILKESDDKDSLKKKISDIILDIDKFKKAYEDSGIKIEQKENVKKSLKPIRNILITSKLFYIPFIGLYNSGKSTIINDIIGTKLLPVKEGECTKKGVLIVNWEYDYPIIRKARFVNEKTGDNNDICYFEFNNDVLAVGEENVKKLLKGMNGEFIDKEEDFFYLVNIKIKTLDTYVDDRLKEKICFVDLPGYGTGNKFENKDIYSKFIKSCKLFVLVAMDNISESSVMNGINSLLQKTKNFQKISINALCKKILFVINNTKKIENIEETLVEKKKYLINQIGLKEDIDITFFNGRFFQSYLENKDYFNNLDKMIKNENSNYHEKLINFQRGYGQRVPRSFENYILQELKDKLKTVFNNDLSNLDNFEIDKEVNDTFDSIITKKKYSFDEDDLIDIKKIISYCKTNIDQCNYLKHSNHLSFKFLLSFCINRCKYDANLEFNNLINNNLDSLSTIFNKGINPESNESLYKKITSDAQNKQKYFELSIENKIKDIQLTANKDNIPEILSKSVSDINTILKNLKDNIEDKLKKKTKWKTIQDEFEKTFSSHIKGEKNNIISKLENSSDKIEEYKKEAYDLIKEFKTDPENIKNNVGELKTYISNRLGEKNDYKVAIDNIVEDILSRSKNVTDWKNSSGLIDYLKGKLSDKFYLNKTIDFIIDNSKNELENFQTNISEIIKNYTEEVIKPIDIEKTNINSILKDAAEKEELEKKKAEKELERIKQKNEEDNKKWNPVCEEYENLKLSLKDIQKDEKTSESQEIAESSETPTPQ